MDQHYQELDSVIKVKSLYLRPALCLNDLSVEANISVEHIKQVLSEKLNLTFFEFIAEYKVGEAKRLLIKLNDDHFSITNVATESGFKTNDSFVTIFEKHTNLSPENYRIKYFNLNPETDNLV